MNPSYGVYFGLFFCVTGANFSKNTSSNNKNIPGHRKVIGFFRLLVHYQVFFLSSLSRAIFLQYIQQKDAAASLMKNRFSCGKNNENVLQV